MALARGLVVAALLTPLLATGCVAPRVGADSVTLTFACHNHEVLHYRSLIEAFHAEHPEMVIRLTSLEELDSHFPDHPAGTIGTAAQAVDVLVSSAPDPDLDLEGVLLDLTPYARAAGLYPGDALFAGTVEPFVRGGRLYGLPHQAHAYVLYYDPRAFEEAGLSPPRPGWTRAEFGQAAIATTQRRDGATWRYGFVDRWPGYTIAALSRSSEGPATDLDVVALADGLLWYADLVRVHGAMPDPSAPDAADVSGALLLGEHPPAMWTGHSFEAGRFRRRYGAEVAPLPQGLLPATPITLDGYMISANTFYPEAAWEWIEFLSRQPSAAYYGGIMARRSAAYWDALDDTTADVFRYCLEHGVYVGPDVWTPVQTGLVEVLRGAPLGEVMERGGWGASAHESKAPAERWGEAPVEAWLLSSVAEHGDGERRLAARVAVAPQVLPETGIAEAVTIRFGVRSGEDAWTYRQLADRLALERHDITVEVVAADAPADCFVDGAEVAHQAPEARLVPVDRFLSERRLLASYPRPLLNPVRRRGHVWALPLDADASVLVYNRDRFDAAGLAYPTDAWTAQSLVEHAMLLASPLSEPTAYGYWPRGGATARAGEMIAWLGGSLLDEAGWPTLDSPTAVAAMQRYRDLLATAPPMVDAEGADGVLPWGAYPAYVEGGQVAMWIDDYASAKEATSRYDGLRLAPLPQGAVMPSPTLERALYISAESAHPEACWEWLWYLGGRPEAAGLFPARRDVAKSQAWRQRVGSDAADAWLAMLSRWDQAGDAWGPYSDGTTLRWVDRAFAEVLQGADPRGALARAQEAAVAYAECMASPQGPVASWEECLRVAEEREAAEASE